MGRESSKEDPSTGPAIKGSAALRELKKAAKAKGIMTKR
jgi:hypothetical protein